MKKEDEVYVYELKEKLRIAKEALEKISKSFISNEGSRPTSEWSMGNYDDVFSDGITMGEHYQAEIAKKALAELGEK